MRTVPAAGARCDGGAVSSSPRYEERDGRVPRRLRAIGTRASSDVRTGKDLSLRAGLSARGCNSEAICRMADAPGSSHPSSEPRVREIVCCRDHHASSPVARVCEGLSMECPWIGPPCFSGRPPPTPRKTSTNRRCPPTSVDTVPLR